MKWLKKVKEEKNYTITVDNDDIYIYDTEKEERVFTFDSFGQEFIVDMLNAFGYDSEHC